MRSRTGILGVSLDFELFWGVRDHRRLDEYRDNLVGARRVVPALLECFAEFGVHATWATVGFLFFRTRDELLAALPENRPAYTDQSLSPYDYASQTGPDEDRDPYHYAASLIGLIRGQAHQEVATTRAPTTIAWKRARTWKASGPTWPRRGRRQGATV